jgi:predicted CXXCH cytochrome family protein
MAFEDDRVTKKSTPYNTLLLYTCVGCHTATDGSTWKDTSTGAPIVHNTSPPTYGASSDEGTTYQGLAAGNFYWVTQHDANGHNVFSDDTYLNQAPGNSAGCANNSCHYNFDQSYTGAGFLNGRTGCQGCHMVSGAETPSITTWHHADDSGPVVDSAQEGWYRFLAGHRAADGYGVSGIEDDDWEKITTSSIHNEYLGALGDKTDDKQGLKLLDNAMTGFCVGCHGIFHVQDDTAIGASPWLRHPSDAVIPDSGEYTDAFGAAGTGTGIYNPLIPVARDSLSSVSSAVTLGTDKVMCLSCHRAHASPYYKMLRWDYKNWPGAGTDGCGTCHTSKS